MNSSSNPRMNCEQVEVLIGARLDGSLEQHERSVMDAHVAQCNDCRAMLSDIERIVADARVLPPLTPSRDPWRDIEARLGEQDSPEAGDVQVQSLDQYRNRHRSFSYRMLAAAAVLLIAVTAGVTWNLARVSSSEGDASQVASGVPSQPEQGSSAPAAPPGTVVGSIPSKGAEGTRRATGGKVANAPDAFEVRRAALEARYVATSADEVDAIYEREIAALRTIVDERFAELDSTTVAELKKNLDIIDRAIIDSKAALRRDPRSHLLSRQLDRAIEHKMELLRRVALL
jgi:anti-sigma factor RsiW